MYLIPPSETLVQTKTCRHCSASFPITDKDLEFYEKVSPVFNGKRYSIPTPTLCPDCRQQRRLSFRNERKLYKRKCDATGRDIISIYSPDKPFKVYHQDFWWSDKWNPMDYGKDFDFGRGFFEQFGELFWDTPLFSLFVTNSENCEYNNALVASKNCYLTSGSYNEDCLYSQYTNNSEMCTDGHCNIKCNNCYQCIDCEECTGCFYNKSCFGCYKCMSCTNCKGCQNCFGCDNLNNKQYCINNIQYTKEEYTRKIATLRPRDFKEPKIVPHTIVQESENVVGNYISHSKDCFSVFDVTFSENLKFCSWFHQAQSCQDCYSWGKKAELCYECAWVGGWMAYNNMSCFWVQNSQKALYSAYSFDCENIFGCVWLKNKQYCILNKQYTREEYEALVPQIIEHMRKAWEWGEFFPSSLSPFGYNETVAMEYYPLTREEGLKTPLEKGGRSEATGGLVAEVKHWEEIEDVSKSPALWAPSLQRGLYFNWSDYEPPFPKVEKIIPADKLPDDISQIPDDILNWAIECEVTKKPFRIIKQELEFYRKHNLPIPRRHPDQRHLDRMALRNPRKLFERKCDKCGVEMITTYSPERPEKVYCWACYDMEVLW